MSKQYTSFTADGKLWRGLLTLLKKQQCLVEFITTWKVPFAVSRTLCFGSLEVFLELPNDLQATLLEGRDGVKMPEQIYWGRREMMEVSLDPPSESRLIAELKDYREKQVCGVGRRMLAAI